jgi:uncharacterized small protein (DUF1192 family)
MDDEELRPRRAAAGVARELKTLSFDELEAYVAELKREAARVEGEIVRRRDVRSAADALFRKPAGAAGRDPS